MTPAASILVVANETALSAGLSEALRARLEKGPATFTLVVPLGHVADAQAEAEGLAAGLREAGLSVRAIAGDIDPLCAVVDVYHPAEFDEIIVSTLPAWNSRWMKSGLPQRIARQTGALVRHVEAGSPHPFHSGGGTALAGTRHR
ncbi:MAG TPA: hypothetical protein VG365_12980 [Solirubrobacteraceae bacterium]|nr:hypothetical protein [Solirubrobacteraceae bacterium]